MSRTHWVRRIFGRRADRPRQSRPPARLGLVALEDRTTPVVSAFSSGGVLTVTLGAAGDTATLTAVSNIAPLADIQVSGTGFSTQTFTVINTIGVSDSGASAGQSVTFDDTVTGIFDITGSLTVSGVETVNLSTTQGTLQSGDLTVVGATNGIFINTPAITTASNQSYGGPVTVTGPANVTFASTGGGNIDFSAPLNGSATVDVQTAGQASFFEVGDVTPLLNLSITGGGPVTLHANVTTSGNQNYTAADIGGPVVLRTTSFGVITFFSTIDGANDLTIDNVGISQFFGTVGGVTPLNTITIPNGTLTLNAGVVTTTGAQTYGSLINLGANTTLTSTAGGNITLDAFEGAFGLALGTTGTITLADALGLSSPLASFDTGATGSVVVNGGVIRTSGSQRYGNPVSLLSNTTLQAGALVQFSGTVGGGGGLTVAADDVVFGGAVGSGSPLASLGVTASKRITIGGGLVNTTGGQTYNGPVQLISGPTTFTGAGDIAFLSQLDGQVPGFATVAVNSPGTTSFLGPVGGVSQLNSLSTDPAGTTVIGGGLVNASPSAGQAFGDLVVITAPTTVTGLTTKFGSGLDLGANPLKVNGSLFLQGPFNTRFDSPASFGSVTVSGSAALGTSNLNVTIGPGFAPPVGTTSFALVAPSSPLSGTFAGGPQYTFGGFNFAIDYSSGSAVLSFVAPPPAPVSASPPVIPPPPPAPVRLIAVGAGAGGGPRVRVFNTDGTVRFDFFATDDLSFRGGVRVAVGDLSGDGVDDVVVTFGPGGGPRVATFDGTTGRRLFPDFFGYEEGFRGGLFAAVGDVTGDGRADLVLGTSSTANAAGGPRVRVLDGLILAARGSAAALAAPVADFFAYDPAFQGGVRVAVGDLDGDGKAEVITAPGPSGAPHIRVFSGTGGLVTQFFAFDDLSYRGGAYVAAGSANGLGPRVFVSTDSFPDFVGREIEDLFPVLPTTTGAVPGGKASARALVRPPRLQMYRLLGPTVSAEGETALDESFAGGVRVAAVESAGAGGVLVATGPGGGGRLMLFPLTAGGPLAAVPSLDVSAFGDPDVVESVYVGAGQD